MIRCLHAVAFTCNAAPLPAGQPVVLFKGSSEVELDIMDANVNLNAVLYKRRAVPVNGRGSMSGGARLHAGTAVVETGLLGACVAVLRAMCAIALIFIMGVTVIDVFMSHFFASPITGSAEMVMFAMAILIFSAFPLVTLREQHISVGILHGHLHGFWLWLQRLVILGVSLLACSAMAWQLLHDGLSLTDEPFLQKLVTDKSQKVKETAIGMLRQIQGSAINRHHLDCLLSMLQVREERHLLTKKKKVVIAADVTPDESIFKTGIEKISTEKGVQDHVFIAGQLLSAIDPALLSNRLNITDQELIILFLEHPAAKALLPFLTSAAVQFKCKSWALALLHRGDARDIGLLNVLAPSERLPFYLQFLNGNAANLFAYLLDDTYALLPERLAEQLLDHLSKFPYHITQVTYQRLALQLPVGIMPILKKYADDPRQDYQLRYFKNQASEMMRMVELRKNMA